MVTRFTRHSSSDDRARSEGGVASAEYAVATAAGCGFAALLLELLTGGFGEQLLTMLFDLITGLIGL